MIIWGTYVTKKVISIGQFYCPGCNNHRNYKLRRPKKWGHLYWIPLIPMDEFERYVECEACNGAYREVVLQHDPIRAQRELEQNLSGMLCQLMSLVAGEKNGVSVRLSDLIAASVRDIVKVEMTRPPSAAIMAGLTERATVLATSSGRRQRCRSAARIWCARRALATPKPLTRSAPALTAKVAGGWAPRPRM